MQNITSIALLALLASASAASVPARGARKAVVTLNCATQIAACTADDTCAACWTAFDAVTPPTGTDCDAYNKWFQGITLDATCPDYMAAGNLLSDLAYCYYDDLTVNDNGVTCPIIVDECAEEQAACDANEACAACMAGQATVADPKDTCEDFQAWYLETVASFDAGCVKEANAVAYTDGEKELESLLFCRYDVAAYNATPTRIECCPAVGGAIIGGCVASTDAPTAAPTVGETSEPTDASTPEPEVTIAPTVAPTTSAPTAAPTVASTQA